MPSDDLKKRIEALNKKPLRNLPHEESADIRSLRRKIQKQAEKRTEPQPAAVAKPTVIAYTRMPACPSSPGANFTSAQGAGPGEDAHSVRLEDAICGHSAAAPFGPGYFHIELPANDLDSEAERVYRRFVSLTGHPDADAVERIARACRCKRISPDEIVFLDLETTGLGTTPIFLVGTMECSESGFLFRQYFARDYSEEASILAAISCRLASCRLMITFNGKTFDEPYMKNRSVATGVDYCSPRAHLDLLHEARARYRRDLPNCKLQTLEQMICGRCREDDIPGSEIPTAYHEFVRSGDASKIQLILQHNLYDLLTMADLMNRLWYNE